MTDQIRDARRAGWCWVDNAVIDDYAPRIGAYGIAVYTVLVRYADQDGRCFPSYQKIAQTLGLSRNTVIKTVRNLVEAGILSVQPRMTSDGDANSNLYTLQPVPAASPDAPGSAADALGSPPDAPGVVQQMHQGSAPRAREQDLINKTQGNKRARDVVAAPPDPARPARTPKQPKPKTPPDSGLAHPAVVKYRDLARLTPAPATRAAIAETVTDLALWEQVVGHWLTSGYRPANVAGMLDWYRNGGLPVKTGNGRYGSAPGAAAGPGPRMSPAQQAALIVMREIENGASG